MKRLFFVLALLTIPTIAIAGGNLLDEHPPTHRCELSDGQALLYPYQFSDVSHLMLGGMADPGALEGVLPANSEHELVTTVGGRPLVFLHTMDYRAAQVGPYHEFIFWTLAKKKSAGQTLPLEWAVDFAHLFFPKSPVYALMWKLYLDEELPLRAGNEIGGWNKSHAWIDADLSPREKSISVRTEEGVVFEAKTSLEYRIPDFLIPHDYQFKALTSASFAGRSFASGKTQAYVFGGSDTFRLGNGSPWSRRLAQAGFKPMFWQYSPKLMMVVDHEIDGQALPANCRPL